jgi:RsmE family RNA methyltransferase
MNAHIFALYIKEQFWVSPQHVSQKQVQKNIAVQTLTQKEATAQKIVEQERGSKKQETQPLVQQELIIQDSATVHRMLHVLRLEKNDPIIVFNQDYSATGTILEINKKSCAIALQTITTTKQITPTIHWFLPLLDRTDFEQSIYHLTVLGVTSITPYISKKTRHNWGSEKDFERIHSVMVSAAEQSKQFCLPKINKPELLEKLSEKIASNSIAHYHTILLDVAGKENLITTLGQFVEQFTADTSPILSHSKLTTARKTVTAEDPTIADKPANLAFIAGPEGDLTPDEYAMIMPHVSAHCTLTTTVLKACDAIFLASGIARTMLV